MSNNPLIRALMLLGALICLGLGVLGIFLPGLPTTVFILLAAWFAARGSPKLSAWLEHHRVFGAMIRDWRAHRAVSRRAKWSASLMMAACAIVMFLTLPSKLAALGGSLVMLIVAVWLWLRPEPVSPASTTTPPG